MEFYLNNSQDFGNGDVVLFGRKRDSTSCKVIVQNISRITYVCPRNRNNDEKNEEIKKIELEICAKWPQILSTKISTRSYAFGRKDLPRGTAWYVKVKTSYQHNFFPNGVGQTFSAVATPFPKNALESFLINRNIRGPQWLSLVNVSSSLSSENIYIISPKDVFNEETFLSCYSSNILPPPPPALRILELILITGSSDCIKTISYRLRTVGNITNEERCENRMVCMWEDSKSNSEDDWTVAKFKSEYAMISALLRTIQSLDIDMIYGYDTTRYINLLRTRSFVLNCANQDVLRFSKFLICDIKILAKEIVVKNRKLKTLELQHIAEAVLGDEFNVDNSNANNANNTTLNNVGVSIINDIVVDDGCTDNILADIRDRMDLIWTIGSKTNVLELTRYLSKLGGTPWSIALECKRAKRADYLLNHEFGGRSRKFIVPDEQRDIDTLAVSYEGGLVLEPIRGLHGKDGYIVLLDFKGFFSPLL